jgi:hypothetical protein
MSTKIEPASRAVAEAASEPEEVPTPQTLKHVDEGIGVFRALILILLLYAALGSAIWFAWHAWGHWHAQ